MYFSFSVYINYEIRLETRLAKMREKKGIQDEGIKIDPWSKHKIPTPMRISQMFHDYSLCEHVLFYEVSMPTSENFLFMKWVVAEKTVMLRDSC